MEAKLNIWPLKGRQWFEAVHLDAFLVVSKSSQSSRNVTWLMEVWKNGAVFVDEFHIPVVFGCISQCFSHAPVALRTARLLSIPVPIRFARLKSGNECSHRVTRLQTLRHRVGASLPSVWPLARASTRVSTVRKCADCYKKKTAGTTLMAFGTSLWLHFSWQVQWLFNESLSNCVRTKKNAAVLYAASDDWVKFPLHFSHFKTRPRF